MRKAIFTLIGVLLLLCGGSAFAAPLGLKWFKPVLSSGPCLDSLVSQPRVGEGCLSYVQHEKAGVMADPSGELLYVGGSDKLLHVFSRKGTELSSHPLPANLMTTPIFEEGQLFFGTDKGQVLSVNTTSFASTWSTQLDAEVENVLVLDGTTLYVVTGLCTLYALDKGTGEVKWVKKRPPPSRMFLRLLSTPLLFHTEQNGVATSLLAAGHPTGKIGIYDANSGAVVREVMLGDPKAQFPDVVTDPVWTGNSVIAASFASGIVAIDPLTGTKRWRLEKKDITRLAYANDLVIAAGAKIVLGIDPQKGTVVWEYSFDKGAPTRLLVANNRVYFGSDKSGLFVLDQKSGKELGVYGSGLGFAGDLLRNQAQLFAVSAPGYLYAFQEGGRN